MRIWGAAAALAAFLLSGCATGERVRFQPSTNQQALVRDGQAALVSRRKNSLVLVRPARREFAPNSRPVFVVGIFNQTRGPIEFRIANVEAEQVVNGQATALKVITYEQLAQEERNAQIMAAVLVGVAAGANSYSAARSGYGSGTTTVNTPRGTYTAHSTYYSPTAAAIAQSNAAAQNEAMIGAVIEQGQANLANLERAVIKDNTLLPGEWYGGQLHIAPLLSGSNGPKTYQIALNIAGERHEVNITHEAAQ